MPTTATMTWNGYLFQLPTMIMTSAMKFTVPGMPTEAMQAMTKQPAMNGMRFDEPAERRNVAGMRLVVDPAGHGEEHARGHRMGEHIDHRPAQADVIQRGHAEKDIAHVAGTGIPDDILRVLGIDTRRIRHT